MIRFDSEEADGKKVFSSEFIDELPGLMRLFAGKILKDR